MAFRANEAAWDIWEETRNYLIPDRNNASESVRKHSEEFLDELILKIGPAVEGYPTWHPLISNHDKQDIPFEPGDVCGYNGLDHTRYFVNGFITCPYGDGQDVIDSVDQLPMDKEVAEITAERLDVTLYRSQATPILVQCNWNQPVQDEKIPLSIALPLLLEKEVPCWRWSQVAESWDTMRPFFLGRPHGSQSSLFVDQKTGREIKKIYTALIESGMYGPARY